MPRYIKADATQEELRTAIMACYKDADDFDMALEEAISLPQVYKDLSKVESEHENYSYKPEESKTPGYTPGWDMIHGSAVLWIALGGDTEQPFAAVLYLDNKNKLRAYIPKDGNCYDKKHKMAYGYGEQQCIQFDDAKLRADAAKRIQAKGVFEPFAIVYDNKVGLQALEGATVYGLPVVGFKDLTNSDGDGPLSDENVRDNARFIFENPDAFDPPYTSMELRPSEYGKGWDIVVGDY